MGVYIKKLKLNLTKKLDKNLNWKLKPNFIYNNIYLKGEIIITIIKTNNIIFKLKI